MKPIEITIPGSTKNQTNGSHRHWAIVAKKRKSERARVMNATMAIRHSFEPLIRVTMTRLSRCVRMDDDGLRAALKSTRDGLAARLRVDDGSPLVEWRYEQDVGEPGVRARFEYLTPSPAREPDCYCPPDEIPNHHPRCPKARMR